MASAVNGAEGPVRPPQARTSPGFAALLRKDASPREVLACATPEAWLAAAPARLPALLVDHANCEKKAASTALSLLFRYPEKTGLAYWMSRLAREELRHYEQVQALMTQRGIRWQQVPASRYAEGLRRHVRRGEPARLLDVLLIGALIEARSCERFEALAPRLDPELQAFYGGLAGAERRHFQRYLRLAREEAAAGGVDEHRLEARLEELVAHEAELVVTPDPAFAFHSGPLPAGA
jgi:tRNA-(ms[2]io[6]A)-hydroxylase